MIEGRIVFFDLETGGLESHHPDTQIGAVVVEGGVEIESYEAKIRFDESRADPEALSIQGYDGDVWSRKAVPEFEALGGFLDMCRRHATMERISRRGSPYRVARLGGHNVASFDIPRLRAMALRNGDAFIPAAWWYPLDVYHRALWYWPECGLMMPKSFRLTALASYFGLDAGGAHDALSDARLSWRVAERMSEQ